MKYSLINIIYNLPLSNYLTGFIKKKLLKNNKIAFVPTKKSLLPTRNYPVQNSIGHQEEIIKSFEKNNKLSFNTFPNLRYLLRERFTPDASFNFLDVGGDKLDFYLSISKEFKNINYYLINLPEVNQIISQLKKKYTYNNLRILDNLNEAKEFKYDFVYFGSTLQYLENYEKFINDLLPITKKDVFLSATWFFKNSPLKRIVVKQLNYLPLAFYLYFFNLKTILDLFKNHDFKVEFNKKNTSYSCSFKNFEDLKMNNIEYTDILFTKR